MSIEIGRGVRQQNSILKPSNYGMGHIAHKRLIQYVGMQNARHQQAISVDGVYAEIWIRGNQGRICSCQENTLITTNSLDTSESVLQNEEDLFNFKLKSPSSLRTGVKYVDEDKDTPTTVNLNDNQHNSWLNEFDLNPEDPRSLIEESNNLYNIDSASLLFGGDKSPCGICFGTGWTNGYTLSNGCRVVADVTATHNIKGGVINQDVRPYSFTLYDNNSYVEFELEVPKYFTNIHNFSLYNNVHPTYATVTVDDNPISIPYLKSLNGISNKIKLKVYGEFNRKVTFTHLEINYQLGVFPKIDIPPFANDTNFQYFQALSTMNVEIPGSIPYVDRECVIGEAKNGYLWKVVSSTEHTTGERQLFKTECECRLIQPSENLYLLNSIYRPLTVYNYRGLERIQGLSDYSTRQYKNIQGI